MIALRYWALFLKLFVCLPLVVSSATSADKSISATTVRQYTLKPPVELHEIEYNGTWEQFCDRKEIDKDSPPYPNHPLRVLRFEICLRQNLNRFTRSSMDIFTAYKYSVLARSVADEMLDKLVAKFSEEDEKRKAQLFALGEPEFEKECVMQSQETLRVHCIDKDNPYFMMFYRLIVRTCTLPWLKVARIQKIMKEECKGKRIPRTEWEEMLQTVHFRD